MKAILRIGLVVFLVLAAGAVYSLHEFYEANGECYLLIGSGAQRGVYALNNLTTGKPAKLYDPQDAYGLTACEKWNDKLNKASKELFTFAGADTAPTKMTGMVPRRVMTEASTGIWPHTEVPPFTVHRFHGSPNNSPTRRGNHPQGTINSLFGGVDYPCSVIPQDVATMPGYQWVPLDTAYYHARDVIVWSNWTYGRDNRSTNPGVPTWNPKVFVPNWPDKIPPSAWNVCCGGTYPQYGYIMGGWVRRLIREHLMATYRDLKLYNYVVDSGATSPTYQSNVAKVIVKITGTLDKNGECCDGCIARVDGENQPGVPTPSLDCVYSAFVNRSYLYRRDYNSNVFTLLGVAGTDSTIGDGADLTCNFLGISSKNSTGNFVYLLGKNQINKWLTDANAPAGMLLKELTDVAVSDQWWQTGGIVYAYDKTQNLVYQFVRNEVGGLNDIPRTISTADAVTGVKPDQIGADGFGNLYMVKTTFAPASSSNFDATNWETYAFDHTMAGGIRVYRANYKQKVYKSVVKRDYYSGAFSEVPGKVLLGENKFYWDFIAEDPTDTKTWIFLTPTPGQLAPAVDTEVRTELAVINTSTPPHVENEVAVIDNNGPMVEGGTGLVFAAPEADGYYLDTQDYYFQVENYPRYDVNGINVNSVRIDRDDDGVAGVFPSTTKTVVYYWKVLKVKDRYGVDINPPEVIIDHEANNQRGSPVFYFPPAPGEFRVGVKAMYQYYDYNKLPLGALSDQKEKVLTGLALATQGDGNGYSWCNIKVKMGTRVDVPEGKAVIMSGCPLDGGVYDFRPDIVKDLNTAWGDPNQEIPPDTAFVIPGSVTVPVGYSKENEALVYSPSGSDSICDWSIKVRDTAYNLARGINRIASMTAATPPDPKDPKMITTPPTLEWEDANPTFSWKSTLKRGNEIIIEKSLNIPKPYLTLAEVRELFPVPSQPGSYTLRVDATRRYVWQSFVEVWLDNGGQLQRTWETKYKRDKITFYAEAQICITDALGPQLSYPDPYSQGKVITAFFIKPDVMYGTTCEPLTDPDSPPKGYDVPKTVEFVVADNNPLGNETGITNEGKDRFFGDIATVGAVITHKPSSRTAVFSYTTVLGEMPLKVSDERDGDLNKWYSTGDEDGHKLKQTPITGESEFTAATGKDASLYNKSVAYRKIYISLSELKHFSRPLPAGPIANPPPFCPLSPNMDASYANNSSGYNNLEYGIRWVEASGLATEAYRPGQIVIRDNDRPNAFITCIHEKDPTTNYPAPTNVNVLPPPWRQYLFSGNEFTRNGPENWKGNLNDAFDKDFRANPNAPILAAFFPQNPLETDIPALFIPSVADNAGSIATITFQLASGSDILVDSWPGGVRPMQFIFNNPGKYKVILKVRDDALDWPSDPTKPTAASPQYNYRNLEAELEVVGYRLDVRVIDRTKQGR